jgi:peptidoglycan/xylan/chitin deacetylase (PgdA/CDA1 family)
MKILFTYDVELSPRRYREAPKKIENNVAGSYYGGEQGKWGLLDQLHLFNRHGMKAVCFVEALSSHVVGDEHLRRICGEIQQLGHEVQMHLHPEWLLMAETPGLRELGAQAMATMPLDRQIALMETGLAALHRVGMTTVSAHRAGGFLANRDTLRAASAVGLRFESSYNADFLTKGCDIALDAVQIAPARIEGVWSFPVANLITAAGQWRHMQVCAVSDSEIRAGLRRLAEAGADHATLVSHSFELISRDRSKPNPVLVRRFRAMLDGFAAAPGIAVIGFDDIDTAEIDETVWNRRLAPIGPLPTLRRHAEQLASRFHE